MGKVEPGPIAPPPGRLWWPFLLLGLAPVVAGFWFLDPRAWHIYALFAALVVVTDFFWVDVAPALPLSVPYTAVSTAFAYIAGIPTVTILFLTSWLVVIPLKAVLYRRGLFRPPRYFQHILDVIIQDPRGFPRVFVGSTLNLVSLTTGNAVRWLALEAMARRFPFFAAVGGAEVVALLWMGALYLLVPAPATWGMRSEEGEANRDVMFLSVPAAIPMVFLILYAYRTHGLLAAGVWSLSSLVFHFMAQTLNERRLLLEQQKQQTLHANRQLAEQGRALEERNRHLEDLHREIELYTRTVSHDLRAPLSAAIGALDLLSERFPASLDAEAREYQTMLAATLDRAYQMLEGLQEVTRTVQRREERTTFAMGELVREVAAELASDVVRMGISLEIADDFPTVTGQREKLREVWRNLARNAVKYVARSPSPRVRLGWQQGSNGPVFVVADNGVGIPTHYHQAIFQPFRRIPEAETIPTQGMGLGLSLVRQLVERHGGRVWVQSAPGEGATFFFTTGARSASEVAEASAQPGRAHGR